MPLRLTATQWRAVLRWFVRGLTSAQIAHETGLDRKRTLRALMVVRRALMEAAPQPAVVAHRRQHAESVRALEALDVPAREPLPILGIYKSNGHFWSTVVSGGEAARVERAFRERRADGPELPGVGAYIAVVYRRRLYRLTKPGEERATPFGQVDAFWSYLQRQLRSRGGVRRSRLNLYLAEYSWRYNRRKVGPAEQVRELMTLVRGARRGVRNDSLPAGISGSSRRASY